MHGGPAEHEHARDERARDEDVQRPRAVGDEVGDDPPEDGCRVQDGHEVERELRVRARLACREGADVEEGDVEAHKSEEDAECEEGIWPLLPGAQVQELPPRWRGYAPLHDHEADSERAERDEADDTGGPAKTDLGLQLVKNGGIDDSSFAARKHSTFRKTETLSPTLLPLAARPVAKDRFLLKYVETIATLGMKRQPHPSPTQTPCARNT